MTPLDSRGKCQELITQHGAGCLIVELLDYRPARGGEPELETPDKSRVVLTPNDESRWADICLMNQRSNASWTDAEALEVEARLLVSERRGTPKASTIGAPIRRGDRQQYISLFVADNRVQ